MVSKSVESYPNREIRDQPLLRELPFEPDRPPEDVRPPELELPEDLLAALVVRLPDDLEAVRPEVVLGAAALFGLPPFFSAEEFLFSERLTETGSISSSSCLTRSFVVSLPPLLFEDPEAELSPLTDSRPASWLMRCTANAVS
jgi:hypothetical protein